MDQPRDSMNSAVAAQLRARVAQSRRALWLEAAWPTLRWVVALAAGYAALIGFGLVDRLPGPARLILLAAAVAMLLGLIWRSWRTTPAISSAMALSRIERVSDLQFGTLRLIGDRPVNELDAEAVRLWWPAQSRAVRAVRRLRGVWPRLDLVGGDRFGIGPGLVMLLVLALIVAGDDFQPRLSRALMPSASLLSGVETRITINPPAYMRAGPTTAVLAGGQQVNLQVPEGATLRMDVTGLRLAARLQGPDGEWQALAATDSGQMIDIATVTDGRYLIKRGWLTVADITVRLLDDRTPQLRFTAGPRATASGALEIGWRAEDDFGLVSLDVEIRRNNEARRISMPITAGAIQGVSHVDLTPDPWAGEVVELRLVGRDEAQQDGVSDWRPVQLPERIFTHPVARQIISVRKGLIRAPATHRKAMRDLATIAARPAAYGDSLSVFAGLRSAYWRLQYGNENKSSDTISLLWEVAIDLEDGAASQSLDRFRDDLDQLLATMNAASASDLGNLSDRIEQSLARYLSEKLAQMMRDGQTGRTGREMANGARPISAGDFGNLMEELRERLAAGDMRGAQEIGQLLRSMIENLQFGDAGNSEASARQAALQQAINRLGQIASQQAGLAEQTAETPSGSAPSAVSDAQAALARELAETMAELDGSGGQQPGAAPAGSGGAASGDGGGQAPGSQPGGSGAALNSALQAMQQAAARLAEGNRTAGMTSQQQALRALAEAREELQARQRAQAGGQAGPGGMRGAGGMPGALDPLGRPSGTNAGQEFRLPTQDQRRKLQELRQTLENRAADPARSAAERDYYQRLLKRF